MNIYEYLCPVCNSKFMIYEGKEFGYCQYCGDKIERDAAIAHSALVIDDPELIIDAARNLMSTENTEKQKRGFDILKAEVRKKRSLRAYDVLYAAYKTGTGTDESYKKAFMVLEGGVTWLNDNRLETLKELANTYYFGKDGVPSDHKKALIYFKKAAEYSDPTVLYNLAVMLMQGDGCKADMDQGTEYMTKAAKGGHAGAIEFMSDVSAIQKRNTTCKYCKNGMCMYRSGTVTFECYYDKNNVTMTLCKDFQQL